MFGQPFEVRQAYKTALIPERDTANGPITSARLRRAGLGYLALAVAGLALAWLGASPGLQAFALGLIVPGGGFLLYPVGSLGNTVAHVGLTLGTWFVFGLALFAWFGSGNILAPIGVWLGAALAAASMSHHHATWPLARLAVPGLVALLAAGVVLRRRRAVPEAHRATSAAQRIPDGILGPCDASRQRHRPAAGEGDVGAGCRQHEVPTRPRVAAR